MSYDFNEVALRENYCRKCILYTVLVVKDLLMAISPAHFTVKRMNGNFFNILIAYLCLGVKGSFCVKKSNFFTLFFRCFVKL